MELPLADLLIIDHHAPAQTYKKMIDAYPNAVLARTDGNALPRRRTRAWRPVRDHDRVSADCGAHRARLPVKTRVYAPPAPDLTGVRTQAGDYVETQLAERMDRPQLVGDLVTNWHKYGERRKTVALSRLASRTRSTSRMNLSIRRSGRKHRRHDTKGRAGPQHMPRLQNSGISRLGISGSLRSKMCLSNARRRPRATFNGLTRST
jgi:hypothetical protein